MTPDLLRLLRCVLSCHTRTMSLLTRDPRLIRDEEVSHGSSSVSGLKVKMSNSPNTSEVEGKGPFSTIWTTDPYRLTGPLTRRRASPGRKEESRASSRTTEKVGIREGVTV